MPPDHVPATGGRPHARGSLRAARAIVILLGVLRGPGAARGDEGMWLFDQPPRERLQRDHHIELAEEWLHHLRGASVRFNSGGSGSFVSADGLVLTNHHVGIDAIQKLSSAGRDLVREGFLAASPAEELRCHDLELNVLQSIEDVTRRVDAAVQPRMTPDEAFAARRRVMAEIEQESLAATRLRSDVVTLYQGGAYHLYRVKKFTDVRLVFAPEQQIAFFGGDADNFEFPRYDLDVCFFRVYEDGRPARVPHHLRWASKPLTEGDLVFVAGHPGHTDRDNTVAELVALRDRRLPFELGMLNRLESLYAAYAAEGPEEARQARDDLFGVQNGRKARGGVLAGLLDPAIMHRKRDDEEAFRGRAGAGVRQAHERIEAAERELAGIATRHALLEGGVGFNSQSFRHARTILRAAAESALPSAERLREFRDSNRESLELALFSEEPLYDAFETVKLADSLTVLATTLGADDPLVARVLGGLSPRARAARCVAGTALGRRADGRGDDARRALMAGGAEAVARSTDPMLELARAIDGEARGLRRRVEAAQEVKRQAHAEIARARFEAEGPARYPDATFTLRLAYGTVRGVPPDVSAFTTYAGLFARTDEKRGVSPFDLPPRWQRVRAALEHDAGFLATPFNFISTADIIGGNSGSPVVDRAGDLVGLIFDGNSDSLVLDVVYDDARARAVAVDARGIMAALEKVYDARGLVAELRGRVAGGSSGAGSTSSAEPAPDAAGWRSLFDGRTLSGWRTIDFGRGNADAAVVADAIRIPRGEKLAGIVWTGTPPRDDYELVLAARRVDGGDFFCGLTFPVGEAAVSLILGGWGGELVGLSSINGDDAASNATAQSVSFEQGRWYDVRIRVGPESIECYLDDELIVDQPREGQHFSLRIEVEPCRPLGIATYATVGEVRDVRWRSLGGAPEPLGGAPDANRPDPAPRGREAR